ncbi:serine hydrolase, partial [Lactobacillus delbrueckii subsp. bulgaricus]|nr:serine hydrolase [Lactobacillus delbrueckii subsp. bulgaricus]
LVILASSVYPKRGNEAWLLARRQAANTFFGGGYREEKQEYIVDKCKPCCKIVFAKVTDVNEEEGNERRLPDFRRGMAGYAGRLDPGPGK